MYSIATVALVIKCKAQIITPNSPVEHLLTDSRRLVFAGTTLFFAIETKRNDGSRYIDELYQRGLRNFVIGESTEASYADCNYLVTPNPLRALQQLAAWHRQQFTIPVIGITGSNGKTMVKEWLYQLLSDQYNIVRSPKSYNSQVGVPLSVWQMNASHTLAIFEAGISQPNEMEYLQTIIKPTMGVLTNIGEAHSEGFTSINEKLAQKLLLFKEVNNLVYCKDCDKKLGSQPIAVTNISNKPVQVLCWGTLTRADMTIIGTTANNGNTTIRATLTNVADQLQITIPFTDKASIDNAVTCWCVLLQLGVAQSDIIQKMTQLQPLDMRMQLKKGVNNCTIINDSYNNDLSSIELALDYLSQQSAGRKTTLVLSDIYQSGHTIKQLAGIVFVKANNRHINRIIFIGPDFYSLSDHEQQNTDKNRPVTTEFYASTDAFLQTATSNHFQHEVVLFKGSRVFAFERLVHWLEEKAHQTVLEVNMNALVHNLVQYQNILAPGTKVMAMVKAFSYGSGSAEIASVLQFHKVDYLAVAYTDEGVELRKAGIHMPIMVMNAEQVTFDLLVENNLEPELYSPAILKAFDQYLANLAIPQYPVHIKLDTGMHRLGFNQNDIDMLTQTLTASRRLAVQSVFSHLVASENPAHDTFTLQQATLFNTYCQQIEKAIGYPFLKHLTNTAGIARHPLLQYNMVRLGIGLYGVDSSNTSKLKLQTVATLKSTIAQIRNVNAGESVGYGRHTLLAENATIATIRIGYADGYCRNLGNGIGKVYVNGNMAPTIGNVCMDMTMIDITGIEGISEGDEVELFGENIPVKQVAAWSQTIAYEILTGISQRVKRTYFQE